MKKQKIIPALCLLFIVMVTAVSWKYVGEPLIRFTSEPEVFRAWVEEYGIYSRIAFVGMVVFQILIAVIPGEPFEIAAGYAFGAVEGTLLTILAAALGSMLVFALVRRFGMKLVRLFFSEEHIQSVRFLKTSKKREFLFLIVYMIPGTPKDLLGYFAGLTDIRWPVWFLICSLGRIPSIVTSTIGGNALGTKNYLMAVIVFVVAVVISGAGLFIYNHIGKNQEKKLRKSEGLRSTMKR